MSRRNSRWIPRISGSVASRTYASKNVLLFFLTILFRRAISVRNAQWGSAPGATARAFLLPDTQVRICFFRLGAHLRVVDTRRLASRALVAAAALSSSRSHTATESRPCTISLSCCRPLPSIRHQRCAPTRSDRMESDQFNRGARKARPRVLLAATPGTPPFLPQRLAAVGSWTA